MLLLGRVLTHAKEAAILKQFVPYTHPSTLAFVDDEPFILNQLRSKFGTQYLCEFFDDPLVALSLLQSQPYSNDLEKLIIRDKSNTILKFNLFELHKVIYDPHRFKLFSVLCSDQEMEKLAGIELCRALKGLPIFRFLFTGKTSLRQYILDIQNEIIDGFIHKNLPNALEHVTQLLQDFQKQFFSRLNHDFILAFIRQMGLNNYLFSDKFIGFMLQTYNGCGAIERYLLDESGSHLFLTENGEPHALIIRNKLDIQAVLKHYKKSKSKIADIFIDEIETGRKILFTGTGNDLEVSPEKWKDYLYESDSLLIGDKRIYYSFLQGQVPGIHTQHIASYERYLHQHHGN